MPPSKITIHANALFSSIINEKKTIGDELKIRLDFSNNTIHPTFQKNDFSCKIHTLFQYTLLCLLVMLKSKLKMCQIRRKSLCFTHFLIIVSISSKLNSFYYFLCNNKEEPSMKVRKAILSLIIIVILIGIVYVIVDTQLTKKETKTDIGLDSSQLIDNEINSPNDTKDNETATDIPENPADETSDDEGSLSNNDEEEEKVANGGSNVDDATNTESVAVLVNQMFSLPENFEPTDLVYPDVRFIFEEKIEKRMLRKEAAEALEKMFEAAEKDGIYLAGVSGYRSHATQQQLFNYYVDRDGYEQAKTYSAVPGTSEHETGLAIDVSGSTGKCAAQDCFADTVEAVWIAENSAAYGFIVRYPKGKEEITGYKYEPWHLRYVGVEAAQEIFDKGITLEEYYNLVPSKQ